MQNLVNAPIGDDDIDTNNNSVDDDDDTNNNSVDDDDDTNNNSVDDDIDTNNNSVDDDNDIDTNTMQNSMSPIKSPGVIDGDKSSDIAILDLGNLSTNSNPQGSDPDIGYIPLMDIHMSPMSPMPPIGNLSQYSQLSLSGLDMSNANVAPSPPPPLGNACNSCYFHIAIQMFACMGKFIAEILPYATPDSVEFQILSLLSFMENNRLEYISMAHIIPQTRLSLRDIYNNTSIKYFEYTEGQQDQHELLQRILLDFETIAGGKLIHSITSTDIHNTDIITQRLSYYHNGKYIRIPYDHVQVFMHQWSALLPSIDRLLKYNPISKQLRFTDDAKQYITDIKLLDPSVFQSNTPDFTPVRLNKSLLKSEFTSNLEYKLTNVYYYVIDKVLHYITSDELMPLWKYIQLPTVDMFRYSPTTSTFHFNPEKSRALFNYFDIPLDSPNYPTKPTKSYPIHTDDDTWDTEKIHRFINSNDGTPTYGEPSSMIILEIPHSFPETFSVNELLNYWQRNNINTFNTSERLDQTVPFNKKRIESNTKFFISKYLAIYIKTFDDHLQKKEVQISIDDHVKFGYPFEMRNESVNLEYMLELTLIGVSIHEGADKSGGHYVGYMKHINPTTQELAWYYYDDVPATRRPENPQDYKGDGLITNLLYTRNDML
jgi:hypothetical protein